MRVLQPVTDRVPAERVSMTLIIAKQVGGPSASDLRGVLFQYAVARSANQQRGCPGSCPKRPLEFYAFMRLK